MDIKLGSHKDFHQIMDYIITYFKTKTTRSSTIKAFAKVKEFAKVMEFVEVIKHFIIAKVKYIILI